MHRTQVSLTGEPYTILMVLAHKHAHGTPHYTVSLTACPSRLFYPVPNTKAQEPKTTNSTSVPLVTPPQHVTPTLITQYQLRGILVLLLLLLRCPRC